MTDLYAYDAAFAPDLNAIKANGGVAVNCYIAGQYAVDAQWVNKIRATGLAPWPNYEVALWELVSNRATGRAAATRAIAAAKACGFPSNGSIYFPFSVDVNVSPSQYSSVGEAFKGINDVNKGQYLIACYGQGGLIDYLHNQGLTQGKGWLSASSSFPGWNPDSSNVCLVQGHRRVTGGWQYLPSPVANTDQNTITDINALRAWWPNSSPFVPGGNFMAGLTDAQQVDLYNLIRRMSFGLDDGDPTTPYATRGEITKRLRSLDANIDTQLSFAVSAANAAKSSADTAVTTVKTIKSTSSADVAAAVIAALPKNPTKDEIAAAVIAALPPSQGGPVQYEGTVQLSPKTS